MILYNDPTIYDPAYIPHHHVLESVPILPRSLIFQIHSITLHISYFMFNYYFIYGHSRHMVLL